MLKQKINQFVLEHTEQMYTTLKSLCAIPAPSHFEQERAQYCKRWLESAGATGVYIDEALNVIFPYRCENSNNITVFSAHLDTVFPDREPMPYIDDGEKIHSLGVSDDTASVVVLLFMAKYFIESKPDCENGIMFVYNSCEEGLGNLKGTRQLFADLDGRIGRFIAFDSTLDSVSDRCVGSHRYEVEVTTKGGHSFGSFGNENAIHTLSGLVNEIYKISVPQKENTKTTYNVGTISGGTSVNTIAQNVKMLCEYRSDDMQCLMYMQKRFEEIFADARARGVNLSVKKVGDRPCGNTEEEKIARLKNAVVPVIEKEINKKVSFRSGSTDCNIPLSLGIPAICVGVNMHKGVHTREEWVDKKSMVTGLKVAIMLGNTMCMFD